MNKTLRLNDSDEHPKRIDEGREPVSSPIQQVTPDDDKGRPPVTPPIVEQPRPKESEK